MKTWRLAQGERPYDAFPLLRQSTTDGWMLGAITKCDNEGGCTSGDAFVQAPDGRRAGLVWDVGGRARTRRIAGEPNAPGGWGLYHVRFPDPIYTIDDLVAAFRRVLPTLMRAHARQRGKAAALAASRRFTRG